MNIENIKVLFMGFMIGVSFAIFVTLSSINFKLYDIRAIESEQRDILNITYDMQKCQLMEYKHACLVSNNIID